jgi:hypothetical protein
MHVFALLAIMELRHVSIQRLGYAAQRLQCASIVVLCLAERVVVMVLQPFA